MVSGSAIVTRGFRRTSDVDYRHERYVRVGGETPEDGEYVHERRFRAPELSTNLT